VAFVRSNAFRKRLLQALLVGFAFVGNGPVLLGAVIALPQQQGHRSLELALNNLATWWVGKTHCGCKTWFDESGSGTRDEEWTFSASSDGSYVHQLSSDTSRSQKEGGKPDITERVELSDQRIIARQQGSLPAVMQLIVKGVFPEPAQRRPLPEFHPELIFAGYSNADAMYYLDLVKLPKCRVKVSDSEFDGEPASKYSFDLPGRGEYEFIVAGDPPLVRRGEIRKTRSHEVYVRDFFDVSHGFPVKRRGDGMRHVINRIDYKSVDGVWIPEILELEYFYTENGVPNSPHWKLKIEISEVEPFHLDDTRRAQFTELPVKNGTPIDVAGKAGLAYEFRDGRIERVVEHASIAEVDGIRFRKLEESGYALALWIGVPLAMALVGIVAWIRRNGNG
jgi:hypothetical protein